MLRRRKTALVEVSVSSGPVLTRHAVSIRVEAPVRNERETAMLVRWARDACDDRTYIATEVERDLDSRIDALSQNMDYVLEALEEVERGGDRA